MVELYESVNLSLWRACPASKVQEMVRVSGVEPCVECSRRERSATIRKFNDLQEGGGHFKSLMIRTRRSLNVPQDLPLALRTNRLG